MRALNVLELVAAATEPPTFAQIGAELGIPNSSLFYLLSTLSKCGYLRQEQTKGGYTLGSALFALVGGGNRIEWAQTVQPLVDHVWEQTKETTSYFEPRGDELECVIGKLAQHSLMSVHRVGQRAPMYVFSGGKIVLANMDEEDLARYFKRTPLNAFTKHTLTTIDGVRRELDEVRRTGFGISREEHSIGVIGVSVALKTPSELIGTLGVAVPAARFDKKTLASIKAALAEAAAAFTSGQPGSAVSG